MRRRDFLGVLGGAAATWPLAARAQQADRVRRIGVLLPGSADDAEFQARVAAFLQGLALLGWNIGRNLRIDIRWAGTNAAEIRRHAAELAALAPDVILAHATSTVGPLLQATRTVPIVFPSVVDPVGAGLIDSLARPGGNATGFMHVRIHHCREMARVAQADRPRRGASGGASRCRPWAPAPASLPSFKPRRRRSGSRSIRSTSAMRPRSSAPSQPSRARRTAA